MDDSIKIVGNYSLADQTNVNPIGLAALIILGITILVLPRRWATIPVLVMACFVSLGQRLYIAGMNFDFLRIILIFGLFRVFLRNELCGFRWRSIDTAVVFWAVCSALLFICQVGLSGVVNQLGTKFNALGSYFLFRCLIRDWSDIEFVIRVLISISVILALLFLVEKSTARNVFAIFGGVPEITEIREGRLRCQGAYSHPILAGCFWAGLLPLFAALWWKSSAGCAWAIVGGLACLTIVVCTASSTPLMGTIIALIGGLMYFARRYMRPIRWGILFALISLHIVMKAPVWYLISRVNVVGGSTGWHRTNLIDQAIRHFDQWWLTGCSGYTVASWGVFQGDVTNEYIQQGVQGGILSLCLFVFTICIAFRYVGLIWRRYEQDRFRLALSWALGVSLFVHCMNFLGVSYFGQLFVVWYLLLAMIAGIDTKPYFDRPLRLSKKGYHGTR
jgi:hypothetical protein